MKKSPVDLSPKAYTDSEFSAIYRQPKCQSTPPTQSHNQAKRTTENNGHRVTIATPTFCTIAGQYSSTHTPTFKPMTLSEKFNGSSTSYQQWRDSRLQIEHQLSGKTPASVLLCPRLKNSNTHTALTKICAQVENHGYALYEWSDAPDNISEAVGLLHRTLGLTQPDTGVLNDTGTLSLLKDMSGTDQGKFIPYTSRPMGWHTDGYYNDQQHTLRCFTLHCVSPAASGGSLSLLDYELLFIALNDDSIEHGQLLSHPQAMTLPANKDNLGHDRPDRSAAVFYCHADGGLGSRFTTRTKNIHWRNADTEASAIRAIEILNNQTHHTIRLESGQGIITRNILHRREAFIDDTETPRQMLRGRYLDKPTMPAK